MDAAGSLEQILNVATMVMESTQALGDQVEWNLLKRWVDRLSRRVDLESGKTLEGVRFFSVFFLVVVLGVL